MNKKHSFTMADRRPSRFHFFDIQRIAFTMAEILLSLTIIGIVAAITLPSLTANFQDKAFNAKRQALHARLSQAFRMMDYNEYLPTDINTYDENTGIATYTNVDKFVEDLGKSLSIKRVYDDSYVFGSGDEWYPIVSADSRYPFAGHQLVFFQTVNGEGIVMLLNDPTKSDKKYPLSSMCFVLVYDLNGPKGPNKFGKDMGVMGGFYPDHIELYAPMLGAITDNMVNEDCDPSDSSCQRYKYPNYRLATPEELITLYGYNGSDFAESTSCAIDGRKYSFGSLLEGNTSESDSCIYPLITNDGSAPKNGVEIDVNENNSGNE